MLVKINFLPYRELAATHKKERFNYLMLAAALLGGACALLAGYMYDRMVVNQEDRNAYLRSEIAKLDSQLTEVSQINHQLKAVERQRDTVYALQTNRTHSIEWLEMLVRRVPEGIYITDVDQTGIRYTIKGTALDNERVSQFMTQLEQVQWVQKLELIETKSNTVQELQPATGLQVSRNLYDFSIAFDRAQPTQATKAGEAGASATTPNPSVPVSVLPKSILQYDHIQGDLV